MRKLAISINNFSKFGVTIYFDGGNSINMSLSKERTEWSIKSLPRFQFCDNFRKCTLILIIFSPLEQEIYDT